MDCPFKPVLPENPISFNRMRYRIDLVNIGELIRIILTDYEIERNVDYSTAHTSAVNLNPIRKIDNF
jgi:hypothetical protein